MVSCIFDQLQTARLPMKKYVPIVFLMLNMLFIQTAVKAETFYELNNRLTGGFQKDKLKKEMRLEKERFLSTNDSLHLFKSKLIETYIFSNDNKQRLKALVWLEQNCGNNRSVNILTCYHIGCLFSNEGVYELSQKYAYKLNRMLKKNEDYYLASIQLMAANYFAEGNYVMARKNYLKVIKESSQTDYLLRSSIYNNLALSYLKERQYDKAENYFRRSYEILNFQGEKSREEKHFLYVVEGNIGSACYYQKKYDEATLRLEKELNHCLYGESEPNQIVSPLTQLLDIYTIRKNTAKEQYILGLVDSLIKIEYATNAAYPTYLKIAFDHSVATNDLSKANKLSTELLKQLDRYNKKVNASTNDLINILYEDRVEQYSNESKTQKLLLSQAIDSKKLSQSLLAITLFIGVLIVSMLVFQYRNKRKNLLKDAMIMDQQRQLLNKEKILLKNENQFQQEKITSLAMNLSIKKETEKVFLNKLNEIKRKKSIDTIEVIKELQLIVNNLLNIDEKMIQGTIEANQIDQKFKLNLLKLHPELTDDDIQFCCYFKLKLSAKEIGSIQGLSDISVRVMKNKIKRKIGLSTEVSLNHYLDKIEVSLDDGINV